MRAGMRMTYTAPDDGSHEDLYNTRDGDIPDFITTLAGKVAWHSGPDVFVTTPPMDCRWVVTWHPGLTPVLNGTQLGWPGQPAIVPAGGV